MEGWPDSFRQQGWRWQAQGQANQTQPHTGKPEQDCHQGVDVMVTDLLTWPNFFGTIVAVGFISVLADKLGWWE